MSEPVPPNYYISVVSDQWLHAKRDCQYHLGTSFFWRNSRPPTPLLDLQSLPLSALHNKEFENRYSSTIQTFNKIQTQACSVYIWRERLHRCSYKSTSGRQANFSTELRRITSTTLRRVDGSSYHHRICCKCLDTQVGRNMTLIEGLLSSQITHNSSIISVYSINSYQSSHSLCRS